MRDRSAPTWDNQLWHARRVYWDAYNASMRVSVGASGSIRLSGARAAGLKAIDNPHGMIGRSCGCGSCFTCAAASVVSEIARDGQPMSAPD